ncbi:MAG: hypothetical protein ACI4LX_05615 [Treponema sp.]
MIYGTASVQKELVNTAKYFAEKNNLLLIFGATIGSVSKGINLPDSDYDARFLYLEKDNLGKIYLPWNTPEGKLHFKFCLENGRDKQNAILDDCLPFWEATSFFQFLKKPSFTEQISLGLYNTFAWTLLSPYTWDPYGLQQKLLPLINKAFNARWQFEWHKTCVTEFVIKSETVISWKEYFKAIYSALALSYISENKHFSPVYLPTLICLKQDSELKRILFEMLDTAYGNWTENSIRNKKVDLMIKDSLQIKLSDDCKSDNYIDSVLNDIYSIIFHSVKTFERDVIQMNGGGYNRIVEFELEAVA